MPASKIALENARMNELLAIQKSIDDCPCNKPKIVGQDFSAMIKFEQAQRDLAERQQANFALKAALESFQNQQLVTRQVPAFAAGSSTATSVTTQIRPLGCTPTKVPVYTEKDQPGVNEYAFCGEKNLRGSQTLKRTNLHHNYVHDVNHLHNYHNRIKHQARNFNTVVKDCSCVGESEQIQGCACEADP